MTDLPLVDSTGKVFEWPCERREAHHAHPKRTACSRCHGRFFSSHPAPCDQDVVLESCPGVRAHPLTQIGGGYRYDKETT